MNEAVMKLTDALRQHHKDYGEGRIQEFGLVCRHCKEAADYIEELDKRLCAVNDCRYEEEIIRLNKEIEELQEERDLAVKHLLKRL